MGIEEFVARSVDETQTIAFQLARSYEQGSVFLLEGELGSGKTTFAQGIARFCGVQEIVQSPGFQIVQEYSAVKPLFIHIDAYRLQHTLQNDPILSDLGEYFIRDPSAMIVVEWASYLPGTIPLYDFQRIACSFAYHDEHTRKITVHTA